jgi:ribosomal protein L11 methyltransferase
LSVAADNEAVEAVSEILSRSCPGGVAIELPFDLVDEGLSTRVDPDRPAVVRGYVSGHDGRALRAAVTDVRRNLAHLQAFGLRPIGELETKVVHESDWAEAWKSHFPVLRVGRNVVICPTWRRHPKAPGETVIALDPGMAFGTGLHPTTRLCLAGVEDLAERGLVAGARVLDVGCGSGILGVCAGLFGAAEVLAVDTDSLAVQATAANSERNGLANVVEARQGSLALVSAAYDVVLANLISSVLISLAGELAATVRDGGTLLASGIFIDREAAVAAALTDAGFTMVARSSETEWVALEMLRRA